jgi:hypothetical protein
MRFVLLLTLLDACARVPPGFGDNCRIERRCNGLVGFDCQSAVDGPYLYVRESDNTVVAWCGGMCMTGPCQNCPPKEWTCPVY